jgi:hypothetical protein
VCHTASALIPSRLAAGGRSWLDPRRSHEYYRGPRRETRATAGVGKADLKLEVVIIGVSDVDRAKEFYQRLGWRLDVTPPGIIQLTPPGSWCSLQFGPNLTPAAPGSGKGYLIVSDVQVTLDKLTRPASKSTRCTTSGPVASPAAWIRSAPATAPGPPSMIRTATAGCSRK